MDFRRFAILTLAFFSIVLFWVLLCRNNFFVADEWTYFMRMRLPLSQFPFIPYGGHFIPASITFTYILLKVFGWHFLPFQVSVDVVHALNSLALFLTVYLLTKKYSLSLLAMLFFGFSSVGIEVPVMPLNVNIELASLLVFISFLLVIPKLPKLSTAPTFLACVLLFLSPLFHDMTILAPFAFSLVVLLLGKQRKIQIALPFFLTGLAGVLLVLSKSDFFGAGNLFSDPVSMLAQFLTFTSSGLLRGLLAKFLFPTMYFFVGSASPFGLEIRPLLPFAALIGATLALIIFRKKSFQGSVGRWLLLTAPFILAGYVAAALGRASFGSYFATVTRYGYFPLYFLTLLVALIINGFNRYHTAIFFLAGTLIGLNIIADWNFEQKIWRPVADYNRNFAAEIEYLFTHNAAVYDISLPKFNQEMKLSRLWFLPNYNAVSFKEPDKRDRQFSMVPDDTRRSVYVKLTEKFSESK